MERLARSPKLTPLDFFYLKSKVFNNKPQNVDELRVWEKFIACLSHCVIVGCGQFDHLPIMLHVSALLENRRKNTNY